MKDAEDLHVSAAGVLDAMPHVRREMQAGSRRERKVLAGDVVDALALEDVDDLVVGVTVLRRSSRWNDADELRDVEAAGILVHQVAELAIRRRRQHRLVVGANRHATAVADAELTRKSCRERV